MSESPEDIAPEPESAPEAEASHADAGGHGHDEIHMPPNSWWPLVTAIGIAIALVGIIFLDLPFVLPLGVLIGIGGIVMWVVDARKEYQELP